jgi:hypothetical protein
VAVQYYWTRLLACRILPRECSRTILIHPKCQLSFKKTALTPQHGLVSKSLDTTWHVIVELLICISMHVQMGLTISYALSSSFLFPPSFCLSYPFITLFPCLLLPVCFSLFLSSSFHVAIILFVFFSNFFRYSFRLLFVTYFILPVFIFFLFSSIYFLYSSTYYFVLSVFLHCVSTFLY